MSTLHTGCDHRIPSEWCQALLKGVDTKPHLLQIVFFDRSNRVQLNSLPTAYRGWEFSNLAWPAEKTVSLWFFTVPPEPRRFQEWDQIRKHHVPKKGCPSNPMVLLLGTTTK